MASETSPLESGRTPNLGPTTVEDFANLSVTGLLEILKTDEWFGNAETLHRAVKALPKAMIREASSLVAAEEKVIRNFMNLLQDGGVDVTPDVLSILDVLSRELEDFSFLTSAHCLLSLALATRHADLQVKECAISIIYRVFPDPLPYLNSLDKCLELFTNLLTAGNGQTKYLTCEVLSRIADRQNTRSEEALRVLVSKGILEIFKGILENAPLESTMRHCPGPVLYFLRYVPSKNTVRLNTVRESGILLAVKPYLQTFHGFFDFKYPDAHCLVAYVMTRSSPTIVQNMLQKNIVPDMEPVICDEVGHLLAAPLLRRLLSEVEYVEKHMKTSVFDAFTRFALKKMWVKLQELLEVFKGALSYVRKHKTLTKIQAAVREAGCVEELRSLQRTCEDQKSRDVLEEVIRLLSE